MMRAENSRVSEEFKRLGGLGDLCNTGLPKFAWLGESGVYAIVAPVNYEPTFVGPKESRANGNVIRPWPMAKLRGKWVAESRVVYVGLAGQTDPRELRLRLGELLRHVNGKITASGPHKGGEIVWQLSHWRHFELFAKPTGAPPEPKKAEREMLLAFRRRYGKLPFGNRRL